ncbi:MAG TPA: ABC transporter ATP-binding protein [Methylomirabilota bacterium]|jgi:branched-chain amino acid transport system ATP-binding protein|nr:ABC transporter ATP-binding protein [Methylomirabilota bacterium]
MATPALLEVAGLHAYYGASHVLFDVALRADAGEVVALLGRNGAGKTTTLRSIMGLLRPRAGRVRFRGEEITGWPPFRVCRLGIGFVPEDRRIFAGLSVEENLEVGRRALPSRPAAAETASGRRAGGGEGRADPGGSAPARRPGPWTRERVYEFFPVLGERRRQKAGTLSGGEQQMLTIARTLMGNPELLLLDEPSEGLAPVVVRGLLERLLALKGDGQTLLVSEQNVRFATRLCDRAYVLEQGHVRYAGTIAELEADPAVRQAYLQV